MSRSFRAVVFCALLSAPASRAYADVKKPLQPMDVFHLQYADEPRVSPDGKRVVYVRNFMDVIEPVKAFIDMPAKPAGADWAPAMKMTRKLNYRFDGKGYLADGHLQLFVVAADGGAPRQVPGGPDNHGGLAFRAEGPAWTP